MNPGSPVPEPAAKIVTTMQPRPKENSRSGMKHSQEGRAGLGKVSTAAWLASHFPGEVQKEGRQLLTEIQPTPPGKCLPLPCVSPVHPTHCCCHSTDYLGELIITPSYSSRQPATVSDVYALASIDQSCHLSLLSQIYACLLLEDRDLVSLQPFPEPTAPGEMPC